MPDASEQITQVAEQPDNPIDRVMRADPRTLKWPDDYKAVVLALREKRALFIKGEAAKKDKKEGIEPETPAEQEESESD